MTTFPPFEDMTWGEREDHLLDEHQWDPVAAGQGDPDEHAIVHRTGQTVWNEHTHTPIQ